MLEFILIINNRSVVKTLPLQFYRYNKYNTKNKTNDV